MKQNQFWQYLVGAIVMTLSLPSLASAHISVGETGGYWYGLMHPISGLDHILAMVAVGLWAAQMGGKEMWAIPATFLVAMAGSSVMGYLGVPLSGVEQGIIASDFILGLLLLFAPRLPLAISAGIVGILAIFHGYAHGAEMPEIVSGLAYGGGFIISTVLLHLAGIGIGLAIERDRSKLQAQWFRIGGGVVVLGAVYAAIN